MTGSNHPTTGLLAAPAPPAEPSDAVVEAAARIAERFAEANLENGEATDCSSVAQGIANYIRHELLDSPAASASGAEQYRHALVKARWLIGEFQRNCDVSKINIALLSDYVKQIDAALATEDRKP